MRLLAVGKRLPDWLEQGVAEYTKRLPRQAALEIVPVKPSTGGNPDQVRAAEAERLLQAVNRDDVVVALDERGEQWTTRDLTARLGKWRDDGHNLALLIGGAEGLAPRCRERAQSVWGLSQLTLPHGVARLLVAEQIYRAWTLLTNHPYHRG